MSNRNLLEEAIADAKAVRETAIANAKAALEEAFTPHLKDMLSEKIHEMEELDEKKEYMTKKEKAEGDDRTYDNKAEAETMKMRKIKEEEELDEEFNLNELLAELEGLDENARTDAEEEGYLDGMKDEKEDLDEDARTDAEEEGYLDGMKDEKEDKKKEAKKEGRMGMKDVMKEAKRLGEMAKKKVEAKIYERAIAERKSALMVNEDESISEFINQSAVQSVQKEVALLEKKLMEVNADANTMG